MGDSKDGSSSAAQSAPPDTSSQTPPPPGLLRRVLGVFSKSKSSAATPVLALPAPEAGTVMPHHGLGQLTRMEVEDVAIPKADIIAVASDITKAELVKVFRDTGMTRLPVYENTLDTPIGMAHLKDFALKHGFNGTGDAGFDLAAMLRPLLYVPPSMRIGVLLQKMQTERRHMALVIDEYGGVDGLVTIEDLVEQVVGEIEDEHDQDEGHFWTEEKTGCFIALAKTPLSDFEKAIGLSLTDHEKVDEEEIDTLGGLVFMLLGRVPARGEVIDYPGGLSMEVLDADPRRIKRLRVRLPGHAKTPA